LLSLLFNPADGGDVSLRNVDWLSPEYTVLYPRNQNSSYKGLYWESCGVNMNLVRPV
jgi:hypothetical protein